jgi:chromosome segregation protein
VFLKKIEMLGFKSFAERSRIDFKDGVAALLGPNGCGKSNVVDAVKWVLGEQGSKALRAEKMEDVIFNGTENRKALNVAEVALTLANDNGLLDLDVPEVEIKRRLYRNGDSEYYINSAPVRLRDLKELFYDTGVGKSAYSIMEQGKIDQILSNKPEERRFIFEEAAGITKYKIKGQEATRKLEKTDENIRQVEGILGEVKRSYDSLKKQSDKTIQYRRLKTQAFELEKNIQILKLGSFESKLEATKEKLEKETEIRAGLQAEIDTLNKSLEENLDQVNSMEGDLIEAQKKLYGLDIQRNNLQSQIKILGERQDHLDEQIEASSGKLRRTEEKIIGLDKEIQGKFEEKESLEKQISDAQKNILEFEASIKQAQERVEHNRQTIQNNEERITALEERSAEIQLELRQLTEDIVKELDQKLGESGFSASQQEELAGQIKTLISEVVIALEGKKGLLQDRISSGSTAGLDDITQALQGIIDKARGITAKFEQYKMNTPNFLGEFLSPEGILTKKRNLEEELENATKESHEKREQNQRLREENENLQNRIEEYRANLEELRIGKARLDSQLGSLGLTVERLSGEKAEEEVRKQEIIRDREANEKKKGEIQEDIQKLSQKSEEVDQEEQGLKTALSKLEEGITAKNKDLLGKERDVKDKIEKLTTIQSKVEKLKMESAQTHTEIKNLFDNFRDKHSVDLKDYREEIAAITKTTADLRTELTETKDEIRSLGSVNLMAPEEFAEVEERYTFLTGQLADLEKAKEDLIRVTGEIQKESTQLFAASFKEIKKHFHDLFRRLFGGGRAELRLADPDNVLESGIEMFCQPPGKKLENIALLSGGERSLTAVALLFATYLVKPSPFCILDEIDAALDEANVGRFVSMLMEFGQKSQFIVITHNKRTVAGAASLIGVTMEESGVSKIISMTLQQGQ